MCCEAISVWRKNGEDEYKPCVIECEGYCHYHQKMHDGLLKPFLEEPSGYRDLDLVRVVSRGGDELWTR